jgi:exodeoxyribonuclease V alpha subunit
MPGPPKPKSSKDQIKLTARVVRITFQNQENGYTVAKAQAEGLPGLTALVGNLPGVNEGMELRVTGHKTNHPKFGPQIEVSSFEVRQPSDAEGVERYLGSGLIKGVGPATAGRIVEALGADALEIISQDPKRLTQIPGIGRKTAAKIAKSLSDHEHYQELMVFLQGHGVPASTSLRIFRQYGAGALNVVRTEPHRLAADMRGIGFTTADQIAAKIGIAADHPTRLMAGLSYTLGKALEDGHVYLPYEELMETAANLLRVDRGLLGPAFARLHNDRRLTLDETQGDKAVYLTAMYILEQKAAKNLARLLSGPPILEPHRVDKALDWVSSRLAVRPSEGQAKALKKLLKCSVGVLTGGPGTGKTTMLRALIAIAQRMRMSLALGAPTGRAAKRLSEATGVEATTIHRLLEYRPKGNDFARNRQKPLEAELVVIDESSMIDVWLMAHLASAVADGARLILVGDADQLPSVGAGLVLRQVIDSGQVPVARLSEIFRQAQASLIIQNAHRILHGQMPQIPPSGDQQADFYFIEEREPDKAADLVRRLITQRLPERFGFDPVHEVQVLSPMHKGSMGCMHLNNTLRQALNPQAARYSGAGGFSPGDKVMQVRNNYDLEVFNGDMGLIADCDDEGCRVDLPGMSVSYGAGEVDDLTLAYAVTVHKSQGSEYPAVVICLGTEHYVLLNRPLLYTAVTRGKQLVVIVGNSRALRRAVEHDEPTRRYSRLDKRLKELLAGK